MKKYLTCKRCLYSENHPLGITFDQNGICSGCLIHEEKNKLDWNERWKKLEGIVSQYRSKSGKNYDCIVPVTGANDSYYIVHIVKKLGLNPLLVTYNKYFNTPLGIRNLANLRIKFDCDILVQNVNPNSVRKITKTTLREFGSIYWPCLAGQTVFPVQTAVRYGVPLIIWGAHQGLEQVGMFSHEHEVEMTRRYRKDHDLMGYEADDLLSIFDTLKEEDIWQYRYPDDSDLIRNSVRGIYLANYVRWDPKAQHEEMIDKYDYLSAQFSRTLDTYDHVDCYNFMNLHDELKLAKHGYSKVTDHVSREIRYGRLSREEGVGIVRRHQNKPIHYKNLFCDWLGVKQDALDFIINQHRNPIFWEQLSPGKFIRKHVDEDLDYIDMTSSILFLATSEIGMGSQDSYITIGKGWP